MRNKLLGRKCVIVSDNDSYEKYIGKKLIITNVAYGTNEHPGYDTGLNGQALCDFETETGEDVPFSLYEFEFDLI
jgi:hypothetical protein